MTFPTACSGQLRQWQSRSGEVVCHLGSRPCPQVHLSGCGQRLLWVLCRVCQDSQRKVPQTHHHGKRDVWACGLAHCVDVLYLSIVSLQAGNVVTGEMVEELILSGADIIKVGIGPGGWVRLSVLVNSLRSVLPQRQHKNCTVEREKVDEQVRQTCKSQEGYSKVWLLVVVFT